MRILLLADAGVIVAVNPVISVNELFKDAVKISSFVVDTTWITCPAVVPTVPYSNAVAPLLTLKTCLA